MCTERAQERELERKRGGKGRKGEKERDKEKNLGAKKPKLALVASTDKSSSPRHHRSHDPTDNVLCDGSRQAVSEQARR